MYSAVPPPSHSDLFTTTRLALAGKKMEGGSGPLIKTPGSVFSTHLDHLSNSRSFIPVTDPLQGSSDLDNSLA
jgi:hypothetical protein